jgi:hypothetical protein
MSPFKTAEVATTVVAASVCMDGVLLPLPPLDRLTVNVAVGILLHPFTLSYTAASTVNVPADADTTNGAK